MVRAPVRALQGRDYSTCGRADRRRRGDPSGDRAFDQASLDLDVPGAHVIEELGEHHAAPRRLELPHVASPRALDAAHLAGRATEAIALHERVDELGGGELGRRGALLLGRGLELRPTLIAVLTSYRRLRVGERRRRL